MNVDRWRRIKKLHSQALELADSERRTFLEAECEGDDELLQEVLTLLGDQNGDDFLETPPLEGSGELQPKVRTTIGDFQLLDVIGRGGMGVVYRARQMSLDREVAIKVLPRPAAMEQRRVDRFKREAHAAAKLKHPNIVPIHFVGEDEGLHYFVMQYIEGRSLHEELDLQRQQGKGGLDEEPILPAFGSKSFITAAAELVRSVALALHYAHEHGVVHRDVKPHNLLLDHSGNILVADFGLAKVEDMGSISRSGEIAGTPYYMSPEQALAKRVKVDHRTDVFSLGVVLYELLTLRRPFTGNSSREVLYAISFNQPRSLRKLNGRVPRDLETVCIKALSKKPDGRYASAQEFADDLLRFLGHEAIHAKRPSVASRVTAHVSRRRNWYVPIGVAVLVLLVGSLFFSQWDQRRQVMAKVKPLQAVVQAEDLASWPIDDLLAVLNEAEALRDQDVQRAVEREWIQPAIERIRKVGYDRKQLGLELLELGLPPEDLSVEFRPASDPEYFRAMSLLHDARLLLPDDPDVAYWANPKNTFPKVRIRAPRALDGAEVSIQNVKWWLLSLGPSESLGRLPLAEELPVEPGVYRITIAQGTGESARFVELARVLAQRGRTYEIDVPALRDTVEAHDAMIRVPGAEYTVGDSDSTLVHNRLRLVRVNEFWIDRTEVTNAQYRGFMEATGRREPLTWDGRYDEAWNDLPVVGIRYADALAYAEWAGKRLPTYAEWEVAARGRDHLDYPWGDEERDLAEAAVVNRQDGHATWEGYLAGVRPVGSTPQDVSPFGLMDVLGNVTEWTETIHFDLSGEDPYPDYTSRMAKGLSWSEARGSLNDLIVCPIDAAWQIGFRCAKSGSPHP